MNEFVTKLRKPNLTQRVFKRIRSFFYYTQWFLLVTNEYENRQPAWDKFTRLVPPPDRLWADPFVWKQGENSYIFFEEKPINKIQGHINCITLDDKLNIIANEVILQQPYHLSYPFIFEYEGDLYMLPETGENRTIEVYRCLRFPDRWEKAKTLMTGVHAVDNTLLEANGVWWLFTNMAGESGSTWDTLHLFYADHPLSENWTPHPRNPIVRDIRTARPAGRMYFDGENFMRPSQDCSARYGYAINFNRITQLSKTDYAETEEWKFFPGPKEVLGTHTWNSCGNLLAIDAVTKRYTKLGRALSPGARSSSG